MNPDLIRTVEAAPDTLIKFIDGETLMVRESVEELSNRFSRFKRSVAAAPEIKETPSWT
ncbi:MAG: flagellar FlbD family protein [Bdellovibrionota bacterium]